jgi:predicted DNA-binding transcriptional regulator AlpA
MSQMSTGLSDHERASGHSGHAGSDEIWDKAALAAFLNISVSGVNKLLTARQAPPAFRVGRLWRWRKSVVMSWVAKQEREAA